MTARLLRIGPEAFRGARLERPGTWIVAFLADWCPFCRELEPLVSALAGAGSFGVLVADLTSLESQLWDRFGVEVVPTIVVFREGRPIFRADGVAGEGLGPGAVAAARAAVESGGSASAGVAPRPARGE
jgi:thioredoxin 1